MNILKHLLILSMTLAIAYAQEIDDGNIEFVSPVLQRIDTQGMNGFPLQAPQMMPGYKPDGISLYDIRRCGPEINPHWFAFSICSKTTCVVRLSQLRIILGAYHPAEFGNGAQLSKSVNRIPAWRYTGVLTDTQLMTLNRTRSYRYRNSIL